MTPLDVILTAIASVSSVAWLGWWSADTALERARKVNVEQRKVIANQRETITELTNYAAHRIVAAESGRVFASVDCADLSAATTVADILNWPAS